MQKSLWKVEAKEAVISDESEAIERSKVFCVERIKKMSLTHLWGHQDTSHQRQKKIKV